MRQRFHVTAFLSDDLRAAIARRLCEIGGVALIAAAGALAAALGSWSVQDPSLSHATSAHVRNLLGVDQSTGSLALSELVEVGQTVQFQVRDADAADEDLRSLLEGASASEALAVEAVASDSGSEAPGASAAGASSGGVCSSSSRPRGQVASDATPARLMIMSAQDARGPKDPSGHPSPAWSRPRATTAWRRA